MSSPGPGRSNPHAREGRDHPVEGKEPSLAVSIHTREKGVT